MKITPETKIPFTTYKGTKIKNLPTKLLLWMVEKLINTDKHDFAIIAKQILDERDVEDRLDDAATKFLKEHGIDMPVLKPKYRRRKKK